jgi:hypothetical protein
LGNDGGCVAQGTGEQETVREIRVTFLWNAPIHEIE